MMSATAIALTLLLLATIIAPVQSRRVIRSYVVQKDRIMADYRLAEFSIFDATGKQLQYRIKTYYSDIQAVVLLAYPSKEVVANLEGEWTKEINKANFSILDTKSNQWTDGQFIEGSHLLVHKYTINWSRHRLVIKSKVFTNSKEVRDEQSGDLLAKFRLSSGWLSALPKYNLRIFSTKVPDAVYFLAFAVMDHRLMIATEKA